MCHLLSRVDLCDTMVVVAHGRVCPKMAQNKTNCVDLPAHMAMVDVVEVLEDFNNLVIDYPPSRNASHLVNARAMA